MKKVLFITGIILLYIAFTVFFFQVGASPNTNLSDYQRRVAELDSPVMPKLDTLPKYKDIHYQYQVNGFAESMLLVVTYDKETYITEKEKLDQFQFVNYTYKSDAEGGTVSEHEFDINSYTFKIVGDNQYNPHDLYMIATSDEKTSVAYVHLLNDGLYSTDDLKQSLKKHFTYDW